MIKSKAFIAPLVILLCLLPWAILQPQIRVPADAAWGVGAAQDILAGLRMTDAYYDCNPPMSYLIFLPAALLVNAGLPVWFAVPAYGMALAALAFIFISAFVRAWPQIDEGYRNGLLAAFVAGMTLPMQYEFGQRDHLIAIALPVLLLAQYAMTFRHPVRPWISRSAVVLSVPFILMKPHYGLLAVMMLAHRAWRDKRWTVVFDFDFLALACGVLLYGAVMAIWFPDFLREALPASLRLYVVQIQPGVYRAALGPGLLALCLLTIAFFTKEGPARTVAVFLSLMALASVVPLLTQFKAYSVHMFPTIALAVPAFIAVVGANAVKYLEKYPVLAAPAVLALAYMAFPLALSYPRHVDYLRTPLAVYLQKHAKGSSFFMESDTTNDVVPVALYTGIPMATRFSCEWFLPTLAAPENGKFRTIFGNDMAEDLARFKPAVVALYTYAPPDYDLPALYRANPTFAREWKHYHKGGTFTLDNRDYSSGRFETDKMVVDYDVYFRDEK